MDARIVILGGGVGGTLAANLLVDRLGDGATVTVVDSSGMHAYQPGFLYVALGQANGRWLGRDERTLLNKKVDLVIETAERIDPVARTVRFASGGSIAYDYLILATGSRTVPDEIPGFVGAAHPGVLLADWRAPPSRGAPPVQGRSHPRRRHRDPIQVPAGAG